MKLAWRELRRRPGRFGVAVVTLTVLAALLMFLAGLLDGLFLGSTGAVRAQRANAFVYQNTSRDSFLRSTVTNAERSRIESVDGVTAVGGLGVTLLGAVIPGEKELANVAIIGYELAPEAIPAPAAAGSAYADERLKAFGASVGDTVLIGTAQTPITIVGFVSDASYLLQAGLWVDPSTWRAVQNANRPDAPIADDAFQVFVVRSSGVADAELVRRIDAATGTTSSLTKADAELSLPGTKEQRSTFNGILATTYLVVVVIVALFFALLTLERTALYGVLKAVGASTRQLFAGVVLQAVVIATVSFLIGGGLIALISAVTRPELPLQIQPSRVLTTYLILVCCAAVGSALSLRRVAKIDPAQAIGSAQ